MQTCNFLFSGPNTAIVEASSTEACRQLLPRSLANVPTHDGSAGRNLQKADAESERQMPWKAMGDEAPLTWGKLSFKRFFRLIHESKSQETIRQETHLITDPDPDPHPQKIAWVTPQVLGFEPNPGFISTQPDSTH